MTVFERYIPNESFKLAARPDTPESLAYQADLAALDQHVADAQSDFRRLRRALRRYRDAAIEAHPEDDEESLKKRGRYFVGAIKELPRVITYLDTYFGNISDDPRAKSWRNTVLYRMRDTFFKPDYRIADALVVVGKRAQLGFFALEMSQSQAPVRETLPEDIRTFLPSRVVVDLDEDGMITRVTDRFNNEFETLAIKIERQKDLIRRYNTISRKIKRDLRSSNEETRLAALLVAIIMETGIRPGRPGSQATLDGQVVETFGAITLGPSHVNFVRSTYAEIEFVGKAGTTNLAAISNRTILAALEDYVERALTKGSRFIFVKEDGTQFGDHNLRKYFKDRVFSDLKPTDFRKLKATDTVLKSLRKRQKTLYAKIRQFVDGEVEDAREKITQEVMGVVQEAYEDARAALSHESVSTTIEAYVNPMVVLRFLSQGAIEKNLKEAIVNNQTKLQFDPEVFIGKATGSRRASLTLGEMMDTLEEELEQVSNMRLAMLTLKEMMEDLEEELDL